MKALYGQKGADWLKALPDLRRSLRERWALENPEPLSQLFYNYLEYAQSPNYGPVVLKIGVLNRELMTEIQALNLYQGGGRAVQLLDYDLDLGALLLERIIPGQDLTSIPDDEEATRIAARSMLALRQPAPEKGDFPSLEEWCQGFARYQDKFQDQSGPLPQEIISRAAALAEDLLASTTQADLLHGDLHHGNLLYREDGSWVVIDPKGVRGDFSAEIGPYIFNPFPGLYQRENLDQVVERRLRIMAEMTGLDLKRLIAWSFCRTVLAAVWSVEDGNLHLDPNIKIIHILEMLAR